MSEGINQSPLARARTLKAPTATATVSGEYEGANFWETHDGLLRAAWDEFGLGNRTLQSFEDEFIAPSLREAVRAAQTYPGAATEAAVRAEWEEVVPGVFACQLFTPTFLASLREEIERLESSGIPARRPNGMNRYGLILTDALGLAPLFDGITAYCRPILQTLFPAAIGDNDITENYAFTVRYSAGEDRELAEHRDASVGTMNVNLNVADNEYLGNDLYFVDEHDPTLRHAVQFTPGMAIVHKGGHRHAALPIETGQRLNLVVWFMGDDGVVRCKPYEVMEQMTPAQRWGPWPRRSLLGLR